MKWQKNLRADIPRKELRDTMSKALKKVGKNHIAHFLARNVVILQSSVLEESEQLM